MLKSMTGYGVGSIEDNECRATVEIRSVNHRYLNINIKIYPDLIYIEEQIRKYLNGKISRGRIEVKLELEKFDNPIKKIGLNRTLADSYINVLKELAEMTGEDKINLDTVASFPDIIQCRELVSEQKHLWQLIKKALQKALKELLNMREKEGALLYNDILNRFNHISNLTTEIESEHSSMQDEYTDRLRKKIDQVVPEDIEPDSQKLANEIVILVEKHDITEELIRLKSHIEQMDDVFSDQTSISRGKKIDFILQEMNREINTISSKTFSAEICRKAIEIKGELEKLREQAQNIE